MSIISNEHQPGSPVAVDLDELDRLRMEVLSTFGAEVADASTRYASALVDGYPALSRELRTLRARVGELEEKAAGYLHAFKDGCVRSEERITDLESQLAAAREEQGLEAAVREVLGERFKTLQPLTWPNGWTATWGEDGQRERVEADTLPALLRAILAVEDGAQCRKCNGTGRWPIPHPLASDVCPQCHGSGHEKGGPDEG